MKKNTKIALVTILGVIQSIETKWTPGKAWPAAEPIPSSEDWDAEMEGVVPYDPRVIGVK